MKSLFRIWIRAAFALLLIFAGLFSEPARAARAYLLISATTPGPTTAYDGQSGCNVVYDGSPQCRFAYDQCATPTGNEYRHHLLANRAPFGSFSGFLAAEETGSTVLSGHGALVVGDSSPVIALPQGTSLTFWTEHGNSISDALGNAIETGGKITLEQFPEAAGARSYLPGSVVPNYTLYPPTGLNIMGNPITVTSPTSLSTLLRPGMGNVNWAACGTVIPP